MSNNNMMQAVALMEKAPQLMQELLSMFEEVTEYDETLTLNGDRLSDVAQDNEYWKVWEEQQYFYRRVISALSLLIDIEETMNSQEANRQLILSAINRD